MTKNEASPRPASDASPDDRRDRRGSSAPGPSNPPAGPNLIDSAALVIQVADAVKRAPWVGFDLEFVSQDRYWPEWCLLQIAVGGITHWDASVRPFVAQETIADENQSLLLIDSKAAALPLVNGQSASALRVALTQLMTAVAAHPCVIAHSPRQDLWILRSHVGAEFSNIFDTQIAASFCGIGDQVGYARLVADLLGAQLSKEQQWTNWARRPLSPGQLGYALDDVRYLRPLQLELQRRLNQRTDWAAAEAREIIVAAVEAATLAPSQAWRNVGHVRGLTPIAARIMMATASWRLQTARIINKPLGHVLDDSTLVDFARKCASWDGSGPKWSEPANAGERGPKWSEPANAGERGPKWSEPANAGERGPKWSEPANAGERGPKWSEPANAGERGPKWSEPANAGERGPKWSEPANAGERDTLDAFVEQAMSAARIAPAHRPALQAEMAQAIADRDSAIPPELIRPDVGPLQGRQTPLAPAIARSIKWAEQLALITTATSEELGIPPRLLCNRSDTEHFARDYGNGGVSAVANATVLQGWRRDQIGERWLAFFAGTGALLVDATTQLGLRWRWIDAPSASAPQRQAKAKKPPTKKAAPTSTKQSKKKVSTAKNSAARKGKK